MVEVSIGELLLAFVAAMGIPSAIMGLIVWRLKGHIEAREEAQAEKAKAQQDLFLLIVQSTRASIALGEAAAVSDAPRCIFCGAEYEYDYHTFAHLGGFRCPKCGYSRTEPDVAVVEVDSLEPDSSLAELRVDGEFLPAAL